MCVYVFKDIENFEVLRLKDFAIKRIQSFRVYRFHGFEVTWNLGF
jgi:hypothetical protein